VLVRTNVRNWLSEALKRLAALCLSPWRWLTPRAKLYKALSYAILTLLVLTLIDHAFVLPALDGWVAVVSLAGAIVLSVYYAWRWYVDEAMDLPREWIAPVKSD